jgi:pSer/pThr/pTyr-binding forkhead associated (FHA) protein
MKARLFCTTGPLAGSSFEFSHEATIGKKKDNAIVIDQPVISGRHARIFFDETAACYFLEDCGSRNGTKVDGVKVTQKERLSDLHIITLAKRFDFIFQIDRSTGAANNDREIRREPSASLPAKPQEQRAIVDPIRAEEETKGITPGTGPPMENLIEGAAVPPRAEKSMRNDAPNTVLKPLPPIN